MIQIWHAFLCRIYSCFYYIYLSPLSPFAAVSLCGVAGLAKTFPSTSVSGPFLIDVPGFQVPSDSVFPLQPRSSSRALPLHLHFCNGSDVFSFISSFNVSVSVCYCIPQCVWLIAGVCTRYVPEPFQPSSSRDHRYQCDFYRLVGCGGRVG